MYFLRKNVNIYFRLECSGQGQPRAKSKVHILLCQMVPLPVVRPFLKNDVMNLTAHLIACGYMKCNGGFLCDLG